MASPIAEALSTPFIWGRGGARMTPEQIAREREIAEALGVVDTSPVGHWTQGAARMANALVGKVKEGRAASAEAQNATANQDIVASLLGGGGSAFPPAPVSNGSASAAASPVAVSDAPPVNISGSKQEFVDALLPAAIEASKRTGVDPRIIVAQAAQETGWGRSAPGNNYFGIKSHGQGGGQTLKTHEYVGGKRVNVSDSFRTFASPADSVAGYADFLLQNPRYRKLMEAQGLDAQLAALQASGYATDPNYSQSVGAIARGISLPTDGAPAVAAVNSLAEGQPVQVASLDPSVGAPMPWVDRQAAALASQPADPTTWPDRQAELASEATREMAHGVPQPEPPANMQVAQALAETDLSQIPVTAGGNAGVVQPGQSQGINPAIIQALSSPYVNDQTRQIAGMLLGNQMQQQQSQQAAEMERQQRMQAAQAAGINPAFAADPEVWKQATAAQFRDPATATVGNAIIDTRTGQPIYQGQPDQPTSVQEYEFYRQQAGDAAMPYDQWDMARRRSGAMSVNTGTIPQGYQLVSDPVTGAQRLDVIPGGPAARELEEADRMKAEREGQGQKYGRIVLEDIGRVLEAVESNPNLVAGPLGSMLSSLPGTGAHNVSSMLNTIRANVGFDRLQSMRASSPTGGALGAVSDSENKMLQSTLGALEQSQSPDQFARNLRRLQNLYTEIVHGPAPSGVSDDEWSQRAWGGGQSQGDGAIPQGVDPADWEFMTPEERRLFE